MYGVPGSKVISELVKLKVRIANVTFRIYIFYSDIKSIGFTHQAFRGGYIHVQAARRASRIEFKKISVRRSSNPIIDRSRAS